jgi:hypothetical protein
MNTSIEDRLRSYAATLDQAVEATQAGASNLDQNAIEALPAPQPLRPQRDRRLLPIAAAAAALLLALGAVVAVSRHDSGGRVTTNTSVATQPTTNVRPTPSTPTPTTATPTTIRPSAADGLAPFFNGAASLDRRLHVTATQLNGKFDANGDAVFDQSDVDAVGGTDPSALAKTIPGGMPPQLESAALLVWSDLMSRYAAMCVGVGPYQPQTDSDLDGCFKNGAAAAARFPADLASARALAAASPPITPVAPDSHAAGEVAVQVNAIVESEVGCDGHGGFIFSTLQPVVWQPGISDSQPTAGTIGPTPFTAHYDPTTGWSARLLVC